MALLKVGIMKKNILTRHLSDFSEMSKRQNISLITLCLNELGNYKHKFFL